MIMKLTDQQKEIQEELKKKFYSTERFSQEIEKIVEETGCNYITAIVDYCEKNDIDVELIPKLISKPLKEKLKWNATELNFLKKTSLGKLPI